MTEEENAKKKLTLTIHMDETLPKDAEGRKNFGYADFKIYHELGLDDFFKNAHFLTCFIALVIIRLIQKKTDPQYSVEKIIECLNKIALLQRGQPLPVRLQK